MTNAILYLKKSKWSIIKEDNPQFFWDFEYDGEGIIQNLFWSHASVLGELRIWTQLHKVFVATPPFLLGAAQI